MMRILSATMIATCVLIFAVLQVSAAPDSEPESRQKAVLVTGASSGIGRSIAEVLASNGYFVYAGARKQSDLDTLNGIKNVQAVRLDVTAQDDIDAALEVVLKGGRGLYGLVNNAGVAIGGPLIEVDESELKWLFDVNVFGAYRVTQAFAPLIIEEKGRIVTIGSIAGILSGPFLGPYSMSKHATEAFVDSLAAEMERFDVQVSVIEPGTYRTKLAGSAAVRMTEKAYLKQDSPYAEDFARWLDRSNDESQGKAPDEVAAAALDALSGDSPKRRYMVVPNRKEAEWTIRKSVEELVQLNADQPYSYSREQLIEFLNAALVENQ